MGVLMKIRALAVVIWISTLLMSTTCSQNAPSSDESERKERYSMRPIAGGNFEDVNLSSFRCGVNGVLEDDGSDAYTGFRLARSYRPGEKALASASKKRKSTAGEGLTLHRLAAVSPSKQNCPVPRGAGPIDEARELPRPALPRSVTSRDYWRREPGQARPLRIASAVNP
jgi:hypothetical protein